MRLAVLGGVLLLATATATLAACGGSGGGAAAQASTQNLGAPVKYSQVQALFTKYSCTSCHPGVNPSLDLQRGKSYGDLVGIRALEDPQLFRVVAGDPGKSFLYLKIGGDPPVADIPAVGGRMPIGAPPIAKADMDLIRRWILQGAKGPNGKTGGPVVPSPGTPPSNLNAPEASGPTGTGTITGTVIGQDRKPLAGALVTELIRGSDQPGGEEHYRVTTTDAGGKFTLDKAPSGQFLLKAYAPNHIYVSRIVALKSGETQSVEFGLPDRVVPNPTVSNARVEQTATGETVSMTVKGTQLDQNYTLAVNPKAGLVFELQNPSGQAGRWTRTIDQKLSGPWIFLAVDHICNVSGFLTVGG